MNSDFADKDGAARFSDHGAHPIRGPQRARFWRDGVGSRAITAIANATKSPAKRVTDLFNPLWRWRGLAYCELFSA